MNESIPHFKKTRIAPTPSGFLHLGNVLSFALTAILAEQAGAKILLRIDDLDRERVNRDYVQDIFDTLNFLEIPRHEGPRNLQEYENEYSQLHRIGLYQNALSELRENNLVFACTCSRSQIRQNNPDDIYPGTCRDKAIPLDTKDAAWRLRTDPSNEIRVNTLSQGVIKATLPATMQDFVVRKKDGYPAYQLASLVDDLHFGIDFIVRGLDLWPSTLAQLYLAETLNYTSFQNCAFHHHPLLAEKGGQKISKSAGDTSVRYLRQQGKPPAELYTIVARMLGSMETIDTWQQLGGLLWH